MGIGALLLDGIGDTLRVSLTGDPIHEIEVGKSILSNLGLRNFGATMISCPTLVVAKLIYLIWQAL